MRFHGRNIDPLSVWEQYVEFPPGTQENDTFAPKTQCPNPDHDTLKKALPGEPVTEPRFTAFCPLWNFRQLRTCHLRDRRAVWEIQSGHGWCAYGTRQASVTEEPDRERENLRRNERAIRQAKKFIHTKTRPSNFTTKPRFIKKAALSGATKTLLTDALRYERFLPPLASDYLARREISDSAIAKWELGWDGDSKRLVIPARDLNGKLRFLIKRGILEKTQPKYLYTEGFPKTSLLFGACYINLGLVHSDGLIVVEGSLDTIHFHQCGLTNTGGILGTGISDDQVKIIMKLRPPRIILAFDRDEAGIRNIEIAARKLRKYPLYVMRYPSGRSDPQELTERGG